MVILPKLPTLNIILVHFKDPILQFHVQFVAVDEVTYENIKLFSNIALLSHINIKL